MKGRKWKESEREDVNRNNFFKLFKACPIPPKELMLNLGLFIKRQDLMRILFLDEMYKKIVDVPGDIMEFGVLWGQSMALFTNFRGIYEPYNHNRKVIGFDTFKGFPETHKKDGDDLIIRKGAMNVTKGYESYLQKVLEYHESECPIRHIKKNKVIKGEAAKNLKKYLSEHPETVIAMAFFDFDIYKPTKECLELIKPHLTKGSVLMFDQLNVDDYPGETVALKEVFKTNKIRLKRSKYGSIQAYMVIE